VGHVGIRRLLLPVALAASCTALGCIGARQRPDPLDRIRVGVDPVAESLEVVRALERGGWVLESRVAGRTFVALVLVRSEGPETEGPETAVRIVTRRGTALAVDSAEAALRLVEPPVAPPHDLDGDGLEEILLGRQDATQGRLCLRTLTVGREGALSVAEEVLPSLGDDACVEEVRDVLPESGPEALSVHRFHRLSRGLAPAIAVPLARGRLPSIAPEPRRAGRGSPSRVRPSTSSAPTFSPSSSPRSRAASGQAGGSRCSSSTMPCGASS